jgi:hypothetical protein
MPGAIGSWWQPEAGRVATIVGAGFAAGPPQGWTWGFAKMRPLGGQRSTRSDKRGGSFHPNILRGFTQSSNCCAVTNPSASAASRKVPPLAWACLAIWADLS